MSTDERYSEIAVCVYYFSDTLALNSRIGRGILFSKAYDRHRFFSYEPDDAVTTTQP